MVIQTDCPIYMKGETYDSLLFQAALATKWKEPPRDALDTMVLKTSEQDLSKCDAYLQLEFSPFDPRIKRTESLLEAPDGSLLRITKGGNTNSHKSFSISDSELSADVEKLLYDSPTRRAWYVF